MSTDPAERSRRRRSRYLAAPPKPRAADDAVTDTPLTYDPASMRARMRAALDRRGRRAEAEPSEDASDTA
ncbi:hypothetical protein AB0I28_36000 [Phytomonospora sp. NPDC050363]|uniref:hypothetical protein n=1 Tax=Phytomonospora sp. NPDC050363 TaxID=3155642 RepID=UPI0033DF62A1